MSKYCSFIVDMLREAGWYEGRDVTHALAPPSQLTLFPRAREVLAEFGGLRFGSSGAGIECATGDVFINPRVSGHLIPEIQKFEKVLQTRLFPLGEVHGGHGDLIIDEEGRTYILSAVSLDLLPLASTFPEGLEFLLLGKRLSRQQVEATWPETTGPGSRAPYAVTYNKWGWPAFKPRAGGGMGPDPDGTRPSENPGNQQVYAQN